MALKLKCLVWGEGCRDENSGPGAFVGTWVRGSVALRFSGSVFGLRGWRCAANGTTNDIGNSSHTCKSSKNSNNSKISSSSNNNRNKKSNKNTDKTNSNTSKSSISSSSNNNTNDSNKLPLIACRGSIRISLGHLASRQVQH